jgi:DNA-directed RNA polymerase specialized sigma24 family protein
LQLVVVDMLVGLRVCPVVGMGSFRRDHHFIEIRFFAAFCHGSAVPAYDGRQPSRSGATRGVWRQCLLEHRALAGQNAFDTFAVSAMPSKPGGVPTTSKTVRPLLQALPERDRTLLTLRFFENMSQSEIAERLGVPNARVTPARQGARNPARADRVTPC